MSRTKGRGPFKDDRRGSVVLLRDWTGEYVARVIEQDAHDFTIELDDGRRIDLSKARFKGALVRVLDGNA